MFCPILPQPRYCHLKIINLEFAQDIDDRHFVCLKEMVRFPVTFVLLLRKRLSYNMDLQLNWFNYNDLQGCTSLQELELLNINACQKVSDKGIETITSLCPNLRALSIYWIVGYTISECFLCHTAPLVSNWWTFCFHRLTDLTIRHIVQNCKHIVDLNLSGCKVMSLSAFPSWQYVLFHIFLDQAGI